MQIPILTVKVLVIPKCAFFEEEATDTSAEATEREVGTLHVYFPKVPELEEIAYEDASPFQNQHALRMLRMRYDGEIDEPIICIRTVGGDKAQHLSARPERYHELHKHAVPQQ